MKNMPVYLEIYNDLYLKIIKGEYLDGEKLMTELELCNKYFVSRITIQKALNLLVEKGFITRISGKGTYVNIIPKESNVDKQEFIALVMSGITISYGIGIIKGVEKFCNDQGYNLVLVDSMSDKQKEDNILKKLSSNPKISGIIIQSIPDEYFSNEILKLSIQNYPLVIIDRNLDGISLPFIGTDNKAITEKVVDKIIKMGHRNIAFISPNIKNNTSLKDRFEGFSNSFYNNNLVNKPSNHYMDIQSSITFTAEIFEDDVNAVIEHLNNNPQITCIFSAEYCELKVIMQALERIGKNVPEDISVVTFDNVIDSIYYNSIAYIKQNEKEIGKKSVEILIEKIMGLKQNSKIYISADFIENPSIKNIKSN